MSNDYDGQDMFDNDDEEEEDVSRRRPVKSGKKGKKGKKRKGGSGSSGKSKKSKSSSSGGGGGGQMSMIDDAAEESGDEGDDDDEEEDDDENENEYVKDDFVVDEDDEEEEEMPRRRRRDDLEDSDGDDDDDDDDDDEDGSRRRKKGGRIRKMRDVQMLVDDDLDLINEARGLDPQHRRDEILREREREEARRVRAQNEAELRKGLFNRGAESDDEGAPMPRGKKKQSARVDVYDEDGMNEFIEDDIGDQDAILAADRGDTQQGGISEEQLNEASAIFGTDYLDYMEDEGKGNDDDEDGFLGGSSRRDRDRDPDMDYGDGESDYSDEEDEEEDDDDDDLFGDDHAQKAEALRLKREKRKLNREERRMAARKKRMQRQKAELRKNFEPVQLIENFCTEKDDEIRMVDKPERFVDWKTPFHGPKDRTSAVTGDEEEEAMWIMSRIPEISAEFFSAPSRDEEEQGEDGLNKKQRSVLDSIVQALRYMHLDHFEPAFIKRYRADIVVSKAVRENLYQVMDQDDEWGRVSSKRTHAEDVLASITTAANNDEAKGAEETTLRELQAELDKAQARLDDVVKQEAGIKAQLAELKGGVGDDDDDDDDDDLFGKDDDDDDVSIFCRCGTLRLLFLVTLVFRPNSLSPGQPVPCGTLSLLSVRLSSSVCLPFCMGIGYL